MLFAEVLFWTQRAKAVAIIEDLDFDSSAAQAPVCTRPTSTLIPTVTGNTVRSFYYAGTTVRSQVSSTTVSRSDNTSN
jgi:hypothetical protein